MEHIYNKYYINLSGGVKLNSIKRHKRLVEKAHYNEKQCLDELEQEQVKNEQIKENYKKVSNYILSSLQSLSDKYVILERVLSDSEIEVFTDIIEDIPEIRIKISILRDNTFLEKFMENIKKSPKIVLENVDNMQTISFLQKMINLESLTITNLSSTFCDLETLHHLTTLKTLVLENVTFNPALLMRLPKETHVTIRKCQLSSKVVDALKQYFTTTFIDCNNYI
jgi:hypothetical protein